VQEACVVIITELAAGGELFDTLASMGNFSEPCARVIMAQALDAVAHIHSRKIVHRDLKPENMLLFDLVQQQQQQQVQAAVDATVAVSATPTHHSRLVFLLRCRQCGSAVVVFTAAVACCQLWVVHHRALCRRVVSSRCVVALCRRVVSSRCVVA
jgi:hypothetical protein